MSRRPQLSLAQPDHKELEISSTEMLLPWLQKAKNPQIPERLSNSTLGITCSRLQVPIHRIPLQRHRRIMETNAAVSLQVGPQQLEIYQWTLSLKHWQI
jgi:hypothetical protein